MQPKYGFEDRKSINQNYTKPVSLDNHEWVYAQCLLPFYSTPTTRLHFHAQPLPKVSKKTKEKPNVVFIQFDTLGRQAMYRRMPRSYKLLTTYKKTNATSMLNLDGLSGVSAIEFRHLNVNAYNSNLNMQQVYCGGKNCEKTSLLRLYKQIGYATSLIEAYHYLPPHYVPYNMVDKILASNYFHEFGHFTNELYSEKSGCVEGTTWIVDELFEYIQDRFIAMRKGGWFSINNILDAHSSDELHNYAVMDGKFYQFLEVLNKKKALDNTILIILGDHGLHMHKWKELWREFDHRNPFLQILVGKNVKDFEDIVKYLKRNSDKLVTHADIYMTLARFANSSLKLGLPNAINLFTEGISANRTCRLAALPDEWCNCWQRKQHLGSNK